MREKVDICAAAGLKKPDISILSDKFLAEVRNLPQEMQAAKARGEALGLTEWAAARSRQTCLSAQYHRLAARRGAKSALAPEAKGCRG